jgi:hypothetical protein
MKTKNNLLDKYYKGETSVKEEEQLKTEILSGEAISAEKDIFGYYREAGFVPNGLEESVFEGFQAHLQKKKNRRLWAYKLTSVAASILIIMGIFIGNKIARNQQLENNFSLMEQALQQVSESIQPEEEREMLVLWVDDEVEIIIN